MPSIGSSLQEDPGPRPLSLSENTVLALVAEGPNHGFAVARLVEADGSVGRVFHVPRPIVYRALDRLLTGGFIVVDAVQQSSQGPQRTRYRISRTGRKVVKDWLASPVEHVRDMRTEFLTKLILLERSGSDIGPLVAAQRRIVAPIAEALGQQASARGEDRVVSAWRYASAQAALRFLDDLAE